MQKTQNRLNSIAEGNNTSHQLFSEFEAENNSANIDNEVVNNKVNHNSIETAIKIDLEDVKDETEYVSSSVVCYVLGVNPPFPVMDGFLRRIWAKKGIEKIVVVNKGIFLVMFHNLDQMDVILKEGIWFLDKRPLIVKPWEADMNFQKEDVKTMPIRIQLTALDLKYWGEGCMFKLVTVIGKLLKLDQAIINKDRLLYAIIMIDLNMNQKISHQIILDNEKGVIIAQDVKYEWN